MSHLPQAFNQSQISASATFSPYKMKVARNLSQDMAVVQANELLAQDILNKVASLSELERQILTHNPQAQQRTDFVIKAFTYVSVQKFK
ncbi:hypothetical protein [Streptococcus suis]|uniref:hypothetical protein n=1 Tax=Streptococcus suis TaxID=1307 RepID=UPI001EFF4A8D|nr:hypothetical protein [Streptococcus suis]MCG9877819.1 hypothetical protein [Streptococcus suis]HEL2406394.1 hypothetical protein [Streptococcus suis]HEM3460993.1 hypothetical protein [Streptococcus suis]HEM6495880.1 hypothetical protein [Streptococcus suis]